MLEQGIRLSRAKRRFMYKEEAMKALEKKWRHRQQVNMRAPIISLRCQ